MVAQNAGMLGSIPSRAKADKGIHTKETGLSCSHLLHPGRREREQVLGRKGCKGARGWGEDNGTGRGQGKA